MRLASQCRTRNGSQSLKFKNLKIENRQCRGGKKMKVGNFLIIVVSLVLLLSTSIAKADSAIGSYGQYAVAETILNKILGDHKIAPVAQSIFAVGLLKVDDQGNVVDYLGIVDRLPVGNPRLRGVIIAVHYSGQKNFSKDQKDRAGNPLFADKAEYGHLQNYESDFAIDGKAARLMSRNGANVYFCFIDLMQLNPGPHAFEVNGKIEGGKASSFFGLNSRGCIVTTGGAALIVSAYKWPSDLPYDTLIEVDKAGLNVGNTQTVPLSTVSSAIAPPTTPVSYPWSHHRVSSSSGFPEGGVVIESPIAISYSYSYPVDIINAQGKPAKTDHGTAQIIGPNKTVKLTFPYMKGMLISITDPASGQQELITEDTK